MIFSKILEFIFGRRRDDYGPSGWVSADGSVENTTQSSERNTKEIDNLCNEVAEGDYIANLRIGRSWILPQMLEMGGVRKGHLHFDIKKYENAVRNLTAAKQEKILMRNLDALKIIRDSDPEGFESRFRWWNMDVVRMQYRTRLAANKKKVQNMKPFTNCTGGPYVKVYFMNTQYLLFVNEPYANSKWNSTKSYTIDSFFEILQEELDFILKDDDICEFTSQLWTSIMCQSASIARLDPNSYFKTTDEFVSAFAGDGAYSAMRTMVKFWNLTYTDAMGRMMSREECLADIETMAEQYKDNGMKLLEYCVEKLLSREDVLKLLTSKR